MSCLLWSGRRGSLAALPCRDTHSGRQTPHRGVFSLRSRPVRPSARWNQKIGAFAPYKRFAQQNLGGGRIHFARAFQFPAGIQKRGHNICCDLFFGAGDEARTRYLHLGKVALYQMSYARGTRCTIPDIFRFVKHRF